jgi:hypothetical protein
MKTNESWNGININYFIYSILDILTFRSNMTKNKEELRKLNVISSAKYRKNNKTKIKKSMFIYSNSEKGYFVGLWNVIKRRKELNSFKTFDKFYNHWLKQKAKYGMKCPATKEKMTTKRGFTKPGEKQKRCLTNISTDRIIHTKKYTPQNLIFTTWRYNNAKHSMTPKMAIAFIKIVEERYGR